MGGMTTTEFETQVQDDQLARIAQNRKSILALAEVIRSAVDPDATRIAVALNNNDSDGLAAIDVAAIGYYEYPPDAQLRSPRTCA